MPQRLTLRTYQGVTLGELERYVREATGTYELSLREKLDVKAEIDGKGEPIFYFSVIIPEKKVARIKARSVRVPKKPKTKKQLQIEAEVKEQIEKHKQDVKEGKKVAHVPPVKGTVKRKVKRKRKKEAEPQTIDQAIQEIEETVPAKPKKKRKITTAYKTDRMEKS